MSRLQAVIALTGRRIDAPNSGPALFPLDAVPLVQRRLMDAFEGTLEQLVCAAACGADLVALRVAHAAGIRFRIVLPAEVDSFRARSVADRPGDWVPEYDALVAIARARGDLVIATPLADDDPFVAGNLAILNEARRIAKLRSLGAVAVWDGPKIDRTDYTADFAAAAVSIGAELHRIPILGSS